MCHWIFGHHSFTVTQFPPRLSPFLILLEINTQERKLTKLFFMEVVDIHEVSIMTRRMLDYGLVKTNRDTNLVWDHYRKYWPQKPVVKQISYTSRYMTGSPVLSFGILSGPRCYFCPLQFYRPDLAVAICRRWKSLSDCLKRKPNCTHCLDASELWQSVFSSHSCSLTPVMMLFVSLLKLHQK